MDIPPLEAVFSPSFALINCCLFETSTTVPAGLFLFGGAVPPVLIGWVKRRVALDLWTLSALKYHYETSPFQRITWYSHRLPAGCSLLHVC